jgi:glutamine amidotransferase
MKVTIIDYGLGNTKSILNACKNFSDSVSISRDPFELKKSSHIIMPGVGSFDYGMELFNKSDLKKIVINHFESEKPILGICLGLQLFFEKSDEGSEKGIGLIKGNVKKIKKNNSSNERIPIINWRNVIQENDEGKTFYFDHSYAANPQDKNLICGYYKFEDQKIPSMIKYKKFLGCQFHPEKSGKNGLKIIEQFLYH